jgi:PIN domain nuclease of toxin-antitoxin system
VKLLLDTQILQGARGEAVDALPALDKDPFDRILLAQALAKGVTLLTSDAQLARYDAPVRKV